MTVYTSSEAYLKGTVEPKIDTIDTNVDTVLGGATRTVNRTTSNTPQSTQTPYFTVAGGEVLILGIYGEVTTILEAGANSIKLVANPTTGADVDMCVALDTDTDAAGTMYNITGTPADAMVATTSGAMTSQASGIVVAAGTIDLDATASKTGLTKWMLHYVPIDSGATITAA